MYHAVRSNRYRRSYDRASQYKNFDELELNRVINMLIRGEPLEPRHYDHELKGKHKGVRECHIKNDLLLLYEKRKDTLILLLVDIGTHASVFGK